MSSSNFPNGTYEIYPTESDNLLSILSNVNSKALFLVPRGTELAYQLWEVQTSAAGRTTLRDAKHGAYASYGPNALPGNPLIYATEQREWLAEPTGTRDEYTLKAISPLTPLAGELPVQDLYAGISKQFLHPLQAALESESEVAPQVWTFRRVLRESEERA